MHFLSLLRVSVSKYAGNHNSHICKLLPEVVQNLLGIEDVHKDEQRSVFARLVDCITVSV